jgi:membrane associated rhomboid family serine protease
MTPVVLQLVIANVALFFAQQWVGEALLVNFALWPLGNFPVEGTQISVGFQPWQLVTYAFLHGGTAHLALNMFALYMFGRDIELQLGSRRFAFLYGASILAGGLVQLLVVTTSIDQGIGPTVGASGGVFGVLLAFGVLFPKRRVMLLIPPIPMPAWLLVTGYAVIELASGVFGTQQGIAHFAHLGGMLGAAVVLLLSRPGGPPAFRAPRQ